MQKPPPPPPPYDDALEQVRLAYIAAREAGHAPSLEELTARHPQFATSLIEFVREYERVEAAERQVVVREMPSPYAVAAVDRALESIKREADREGEAGESLEKGP